MQGANNYLRLPRFGKDPALTLGALFLVAVTGDLPGEVAGVVAVEQAYRTHSNYSKYLHGKI